MTERWLLWGTLGAFVVVYGARVFKDPVNMFAPPLIVALLIFDILVKSYFDFDPMSKAVLLNDEYYIFTMAYASLCMLVFCVVYDFAYARPYRAARSAGAIDQMPRALIDAYVTGVGLVGFIAQYVIVSSVGGFGEAYSHVHGSGMGYENNSNYLNALPNFMWSALLIGYITLIRRGVSKYLLLVTTLIGAALFAHTYLFGNRSGIIRFCIILGATYTFVRRPTLKRSVPLVALLILGAISVEIVGRIRQNLVLGSDVSLVDAVLEYFRTVDQNGGYKYINWNGGGHELFFNVAVVQAIDVTGMYNYGAQYIYPIINFIPRGLWPDKPTEDVFGVPYFEIAETVTGWSAGGGSAINAVADSYMAFSWFGCLVWVLFAWWCARAVRAAYELPSMWNIGWLISWLIGCVFWATQSFSAFFFAMFWTIMPFIGLRMMAPFVLRRWGARVQPRVSGNAAPVALRMQR